MTHRLILPLFFFGLVTVLQAQKVDQPVFDAQLKNFHYLRDFSCLPGGHEAYLTAQSVNSDISVILRLEEQDGTWKNPRVASFSGTYNDLEPFLSPDGFRLYFVSSRPKTDSIEVSGDFDIWYVTRKSLKEPWSSPINLGSPVNSTSNEFYPSLTSSGNLYFTSDREGTKGKDDIFVSIFQEKENSYMDPVSLGESINTAGYEFNAYINPEETYLLFSGYNRTDGQGSGDLYLSERNAQGEWSPAIVLKMINSIWMDYCPFVDKGTGRLYFTSRRDNAIPPGFFGSITQLQDWLKDHGDAASRIYFTNFTFE